MKPTLSNRPDRNRLVNLLHQPPRLMQGHHNALITLHILP